MRYLLIWIFSLNIALHTQAQDSFLTFKRVPIKYKTAEKFFIGDELIFKLKNEKYFKREIIRSIEDSAFSIGRLAVPYQQISHIRFFREGGYGFQKLFMYAAIAYPILSVSNAFLMNERPIIHSSTYYIVGGSVIGYLLFKYVFYGWKNYPINDKRRLIPVIFE